VPHLVKSSEDFSKLTPQDVALSKPHQLIETDWAPQNVANFESDISRVAFRATQIWESCEKNGNLWEPPKSPLPGLKGY
jgi:hypothetical protein